MKTKAEAKNQSWTQLKYFIAVQSAVLFLCLMASLTQAQTYSILHSFGTNVVGLYPHSQLVQGPDGALYGATQRGGSANQGQVYKVNLDGSGYTPLKDFNTSDGANPEGGLVLSGTTLYGTTANGGANGHGVVFTVHCDGSGFAVLKDFSGSDGAYPVAGLVCSGTTLYGTTRNGGSSDMGRVFRINTDGSGFGVLKDFTGNDGGYPEAGLLLSDATLYGTTAFGGSNDRGTVFKVGTNGLGFAVLKDFAGSDGYWPNSGVILSAGTLYGTTAQGGSNAPGAGTVFAINTDGSGFAVLKHFARDDGVFPNADLLLAGDTLFGTTYFGGDSNCGAVFSLRTDGSSFRLLKSFTRTVPANPTRDESRSGLLLSGTTLYGTEPLGGVGGLGTLFALNTDGSDYRIIKQFCTGDGEQPYSGLLMRSDGTLYGTTATGGSVNFGTVFKLNPDGSGYAVLKEFLAGDGRNPEAGLALSGTTLYGTTAYGGISDYGTVFKINTDGSGYSVIKTFTNYSDGVYPSTVPVISGTTLYGGINYGKVFHINTDGSGYGYFSIDQSGGMPQSVILDGSTLYGTEMEGGPSYYDGMVYRINTDGSGFTVLKVMGGTAGSWANGPLVLSGNTLYGTAYGSGDFYSGTLFKVNTDGTGFSVLKQFTGGNDGGAPGDGLVLCGDTLYGTTERGGSSGSGTVFKIRTNGTDFVVLKSFNGSDGRVPVGNMALSGTNLYGTTILGGALDKGVAFRLSVPAVLPLILVPVASQTAELHSNVRFSLRTAGASPLGYQWYFNDTNFIAWTTNSMFDVPDVQFYQSGTYTVVVTNLFGSTTSAPALLSVIPAVDRRPVPGVKVTGETGSLLNVDYANSLSPAPDWTPLGSVSLTSTSQFYFDLTAPLPPQRFYRAWQTGTPSVVPSLNLNFVPALTLTGSVGNSVRVDYINAIGPTDAWVTLDTVTLTNTSQLYFDVSAPGQPTRLYRLIQLP